MTFTNNHTPSKKKKKLSTVINHFSTNPNAVYYESVTSLKTHFLLFFPDKHRFATHTQAPSWGGVRPLGGERGVGEALIEAPLVSVAFITDLRTVRITIGKAMKQFLGKKIIQLNNIRNISNALLNSYNHLRRWYIMFCIPGNTPEATPPRLRAPQASPTL